MKDFIIDVKQTVRVRLDETKFTPEFLVEFRRAFYPLNSFRAHAEHLAQLHARGLADDWSFIEGYGPAKEMGISFDIVDSEIEFIDVEDVKV